MVSKILIIRFSSIGDIILSSPLIRVLRKKYPEARIDFLIRDDLANLVKYNPSLNEIITFDITKKFNGLKELKEKIAAKKYDVVLDIHNSIRSRYIRFFSGAKNKCIINKEVIKRFLLIKFKWNLYKNIYSTAQKYINTATSLVIKDDNKGLEIFIAEEINLKISEKIREYKIDKFSTIIGVAPSAKHNTKKWLSERFLELFLRLVKENNAFIMAFGGIEDKNEIENIIDNLNKRIGKKVAVNLAGELQLLETAAAIDYCDIFISNDTGLMHLAAARGKKVVAIFGPTVKEFGFFPYGTKNVVVEIPNLDCRPCSHIGSSQCPKQHFKCMKEISVENVYKAVTTI